jgi:CheY-like chemotaxis protein
MGRGFLVDEELCVSKPILLAEDDNNDVLLMVRAFEEAELPNPLKVVPNGQEAIWYLDSKGAYADPKQSPWPGLLVLDLKMPVKDGWDVLMWLQEPAHRKELPVVILSSSDNDFDVKRAKALGANAYRVKPFNFKDLVGFAQELRDCWLTVQIGSERLAA